MSKRKRKGDCYLRAWHLMIEHDSGDRWVLCHGVVIGTGPENRGKPMGHAWIENLDCDSVLDPSGAWFIRAHYYALARASYVHRYTREEAMQEAVQHRVYGPWDQKIFDAEAWIKEAV